MDKGTIEFSLGAKGELAGRWPLRLAVMGEFRPRQYETGEPDGTYFRHQIDKETFDEVVKKSGLQLTFDIPNPLGNSPKELHIDYPIETIKSFHPDEIVAAIPECSGLLNARRIMNDLVFRKTTPDKVGSELKTLSLPVSALEKISAALLPPQKTETAPEPEKPQAAPTPSPKQDGGAIDSILDMVDIGAQADESESRKRQIENAISDIVSNGQSSTPPVNVAAANEAISFIDLLLNKTMNVIVHHPEFQRLESLWRGLKFLVDRSDFRKGIYLEIVNCPKSQLWPVFSEKVYPPEYDGHSQVPLAGIIFTDEFEQHAPDIELLRNLTEKAADIPVMLIGAAGFTFFGIEQEEQFDKLPLLTTLMESPDYAKYDGFRSEQTSRWLTLCFNRFLLRDTYGENGQKTKSFAFEESIGHREDYLWGSPVWATASCLTRSQALTGWPSNISGRQDGSLDNLPVRPLTLANGEEVNLPLEVVTSDRRLEEFDRIGIIPLVCEMNSDMAYILASPTVNRPMHDSDSGKAEMKAFMSSAPFQLYAGEIARFINRNLMDFVSGGNDQSIEQELTRALQAFNIARDDEGNPGPVSVNIGQDGQQRVVSISVQSPRKVAHGRAIVQMAIPLRR